MGSHGNGANQLSHGDLLISRELIKHARAHRRSPCISLALGPSRLQVYHIPFGVFRFVSRPQRREPQRP